METAIGEVLEPILDVAVSLSRCKKNNKMRIFVMHVTHNL